MTFEVTPPLSLTAPEIILSKHYYRRLWLAIKNISIPRRAWLDELANMIRDFDDVIYTTDGQPYTLPLVDEVFGDDLDMRWLGYYLVPDNTGKSPRIKSRKVERLQLLDLYIRIKHPNVAKHFSR